MRRRTQRLAFEKELEKMLLKQELFYKFKIREKGINTGYSPVLVTGHHYHHHSQQQHNRCHHLLQSKQQQNRLTSTTSTWQYRHHHHYHHHKDRHYCSHHQHGRPYRYHHYLYHYHRFVAIFIIIIFVTDLIKFITITTNNNYSILVFVKTFLSRLELHRNCYAIWN